MKIMVKTPEGAQREVKPEDLTFNGITFVAFYKDYLITKKRLEDFIRIYSDTNEEMVKTWKNVK